MRACIIRHSYYPEELNVRREAEALQDEGFDVTVICLRGDGEPSRETIDGIAVRRMPVDHRRGQISRYLLEYNLFFVFSSFWLTVMHLQSRFRVVQVNTMPDYLVLAALPCKLLGADVVLHIHEPMPELFATLFPARRHRPMVWAIEWSERFSVRFADRVLTVTHQMKERLVERGAAADKITVVLNVPDERMLWPEGKREVPPATAAADRYIITHGAIEERYGPDLIVEAMAILHKDWPDLSFHLLGKGSHVEHVLELAHSLRIADRVNYLGFVPFDQMLTEVRGAALGIVPMRSNAYSNLVHTNKMYEYIEFEVPVVASRLESIAAYFDDSALAYFEPDDPGDLARAIHSMLSDTALAQRRRERASMVYSSLSWTHERERYLSVFRSLVEPASTRP